MHWGVYARPSFEGAEAFIEGARAIGQAATFRSVADYRPGETEGCFDRVAVFGLQHRGRNVFDDYRARGTDVYVVDYGYVRRTTAAHDWRTGYWQVSLNGLNRLPKDPPIRAATARWNALGVNIAHRGGDPDGWVLLCVQTRGDASHNLDEKGLQKWVNEQKAMDWGGPLLLRPHPLEESLTYGMPTCPAETLEAALAGAKLVVTGNSNVGHDALLAGVPAVATLPGAAWEKLSGLSLPSRAIRAGHFLRCAWGQWTWAEMRLGLPQFVSTL